MFLFFFFFFQAEDGIRDKLVTGVQTCALPIFPGAPARAAGGAQRGGPMTSNEFGAGVRTGGGALAGLAAGALMMIAAMGWLALAHLGALTPPKLVAAGVSGSNALIGGFGTAFVGWSLHLGVAVLLGIIFAWLASNIRSKKAAAFA